MFTDDEVVLGFGTTVNKVLCGSLSIYELLENCEIPKRNPLIIIRVMPLISCSGKEITYDQAVKLSKKLDEVIGFSRSEGLIGKESHTDLKKVKKMEPSMSLATVEFHIKAMSLNEKWITLNNFLFDIIKRQGKIQGTYVASIVKTALEELLTLKVGKQILKNMSKGNYLESYLIESLEFEKLEIEPSAPNWYNDVKEAFPSKIREMIDGTEERKAWVFNVKNSIIKFETLIKIYTADGYFKENVSLGFLTILKRLMYEVSNSREIMVLKSTINELVDSMKPSVQKLKPSASLPLQIIVGELLSYLDLSLLKDVRGPEAIEAEKGSLYPFLKKL